MVKAAAEFDRTDRAAQGRLAGEVFAKQTNLLASIPVLRSMGVGIKQFETPVRILCCVFQAMKTSKRKWPLIKEDV